MRRVALGKEVTMMDMTQAIQPRSDQVNADDLISGPMTVIIQSVSIKPGDDQPISIKLEGMTKVYRPCKSMARVLVQAYGPDASKYSGRSMVLYRDPKVKWGGLEVGGIRISHLSHIEKPMQMMLTETRSKRAPFKVEVLQGMEAQQPPAEPKPADPAHLEAARDAAAQGTDAFRAWWTANPDMRGSAKSIMPELQEKCAQVDAAKPPADDDEELPM